MLRLVKTKVDTGNPNRQSMCLNRATRPSLTLRSTTKHPAQGSRPSRPRRSRSHCNLQVTLDTCCRRLEPTMYARHRRPRNTILRTMMLRAGSKALPCHSGRYHCTFPRQARLPARFSCNARHDTRRTLYPTCSCSFIPSKLHGCS